MIDMSNGNEPGVRRLQVVAELGRLATAAQSCHACKLSKTRTNVVFARGNPQAELVFVGEGPGENEDTEGVPFVGASGKLLDKMIASIGYARDDVYICNVVKCRPPGNRKPETDEIAACRSYLEKQNALVAPRVIVALGTPALQALVEPKETIMEERGKWQQYNGIRVMPTFHPAYLFRQPAAKKDAWLDMQAVAAALGKTIPPRTAEATR